MKENKIAIQDKEYKYLNNPIFRNLVNVLLDLMIHGKLNFIDFSEAFSLAQEKYEDYMNDEMMKKWEEKHGRKKSIQDSSQ